MATRTIAIDADAAVLETLAEILGVDSEREAAEIAIGRIVDILEIEALQAHSGKYWPGFDAAKYLRSAPPQEDD